MVQAFAPNVGFTTNIRPEWAGDVLTRDHNLPGGVKLDAAAFNSADAVVVTVDGAALANAESVTVEPLGAAIPSGAVIPLGDADSKKFVYLAAAAEEGDTELTVQPLATALAGGEVGYYNAPGAKKRVASGTLVGWTHAEMEAAPASGLLIGPAADGDDIVRFVLFDVVDVDANPDAELYRQNSLVKVNFVPGWADLSSTLRGKVRAQYETTVGSPGEEVPAS